MSGTGVQHIWKAEKQTFMLLHWCSAMKLKSVNIQICFTLYVWHRNRCLLPDIPMKNIPDLLAIARSLYTRWIGCIWQQSVSK